LANDETNPGPFTPGAALDAPPAGDVERQAVASLGGYAYQVAVGALAWIDLDDQGRLYLEIAEDYAIVARGALNAVQVKKTADSVTLNTPAVRDAISAFVRLTDLNRGRNVELHFLTTSTIGTEQKVADRPAGEAGLTYWRKAASGADVAPLKEFLTKADLPPEVAAFIAARDGDALRRDLLKRVHWDCEQPELSGVIRELEERLIVLGRDKFGLGTVEARRLSDVLIYHVLKKSILENTADRVLTRADLYTVIDLATQLVLPRTTVGTLLGLGGSMAAALGTGAGQTVAFSKEEISWLIQSNELPVPRAIITRESLSAKIMEALAKNGQVILIGGSGLGKSLAAREVGRQKVGNFAIVDLRNTDEEEACRRLDAFLGRIGGLRSDFIVFDDLNVLEESRARASFARCVEALKRRDRRCLVTSYRRPSQKAFTELGADPEVVIQVPYFTQAETNDLVHIAGGDSDYWGQIAFAAGAQGHPQLVHAFVMGMAARGWPREEVSQIVIRGFSSDDTEAERQAARWNMVAALPEDARNLLYRLTLAIGRFNRAIALKISGLDPPIKLSGEILDGLIGPWIEAIGQDSYRVSPLAGNAGQGMLTEEEQRKVHEFIATDFLSRREIDASDANMILTHAITGKSAWSLLALAYSVLTAEKATTELLREHFFLLAALRTDRLIFPENVVVSLMLRMAQFKLLSSDEGSDELPACVSALLREVDDQEPAKLRDLSESMVLAEILNTISIASYVSNWVELLERFRIRVEADKLLQGLKRNVERTSKGSSFYGILFAIGSAQLRSVRRLEELLGDLDRLDDDTRAVWLAHFDEKPSNYGLLVGSPWAGEHERDELEPREASERYQRMTSIALKWNNRNLALQCFSARAVMFDEYMEDEAGALGVLDEAVKALGEDVVLARARARVFWRHNKHAQSLEVIKEIVDVVARDNAIERAFVMREGAISAANTGDWQQAESWFGEAQVAAGMSETEDMQAMSIGLEADRAVAALMSGRTEDALTEMSSCLTHLAGLNPEVSIRTGYCHRVARHTVLWMQSHITHEETLIGGKSIAMLPGTCSNPEPPASILEHPLGQLDLAWYMLAETEIASGCDVGIVRSLRNNLADGPIVFMEIAVRNRRISAAIQKSDSEGFASGLIDYLAGMKHLRLEGKTLKNSFDIMAPQRGEIPDLKAEELTEPLVEGVALDALIAFCMTAVLRDQDDSIRQLEASLSAHLQERVLGSSFFKAVRNEDNTAGALEMQVINMIKRLGAGGHLEPSRIWIVGLRFFEKIRQSNFRRLLVPILAGWLRRQWRRIITEERFRLSRPLNTVPPIESTLSQENNDDGFVASLLLASSDSVGSPLAAAYESNLRELARDNRPGTEPGQSNP
jgi:hypothetical protein